MNIHYVASMNEVKTLDTEELRSRFLLDGLFQSEKIQLTYSDVDRVIVGSACPGSEPLVLDTADELRASYFCERRELGVINIGGAGCIVVDGSVHKVGNRECLYIGRGSKSIIFKNDINEKAQFYLISYPAHKAYPTRKANMAEANQVKLGSSETSNERIIYQFIHEGGIQSCQLVMGFTVLKQGSVWNTMPAHTHTRRSEVYMYFDISEGNAVFHFMGEPTQTRHLCVNDRQAVFSPAWSIHSGCGTGSYTFVWAMGGENQRFDDMDPAPIQDLR